MSILLSFILIVTVAAIVVSEVFIQKIQLHEIVDTDISFIELIRYGFVILMILITTSLLFKFGTKQTSKVAFISIGSVFTTILIILSSYVFGIYVVKFAKYNELYGSIGTLLILMFYIWINCMVLLLGFELNATINKLKRKNLYD
jgi:membrane protein